MVDSICNIKAANLVNGPMKSSAGEIFQSSRGHCAFRLLGAAVTLEKW
jgi:hypothetical protein